MNGLENWQKILDAAKELFYQNGYTSTTMRMIAQAAHTSVGLPSYYFGSKESLGVEVYKGFRRRLNQVCQLFYPVDSFPSEYRHFSVLVDEAMLVENAIYRELYVNIASHPDMGSLMQEILTDIQPEHPVRNKYHYLNALTVLAVKAQLVNADLQKYHITQKELIEFIFLRYLRLQEPENAAQGGHLFRRFYQEYQECEFRIQEKFQLAYDVEQLQKHQYRLTRRGEN